MRYIDAFVLVVPTRKLPAYRRLSKKVGLIYREYGALDYREYVGDDVAVKMGLPFPRLLKLKPGETAVFSWIAYPSRAQRDRVVAKVMKDPRLDGMCGAGNMPFDLKRMSCGGFKLLVEA